MEKKSNIKLASKATVKNKPKLKESAKTTQTSKSDGKKPFGSRARLNRPISKD